MSKLSEAFEGYLLTGVGVYDSENPQFPFVWGFYDDRGIWQEQPDPRQFKTNVTALQGAGFWIKQNRQDLVSTAWNEAREYIRHNKIVEG